MSAQGHPRQSATLPYTRRRDYLRHLPRRQVVADYKVAATPSERSCSISTGSPA